ncbi:hypothetical protein KIF59_21455 [Enterobacter cloacae subsp. cloacae]|nr:hypothetical protein [Enterobacter cloacae subsp. cloacae]
MVGLPASPAVDGTAFSQRFQSAADPFRTASLEITALLLDIQPGDEVIMPELHLRLHW